jgi:hypothetical protein
MSETERIRNLDNEVFEEFKIYFPKIITSNFIKDFPNTNLIIQLYDTSGTFIKNSIFNSCETDDYYGMKILYRCLIEHFIRFKFIFMKWSQTKNDEFAKEYLEYSDAREMLDLLRAKISEQQLFDPYYKLEDWDSFLKIHPKFQKKTRREVEEETKKYTFKNIVHHLNNQIKKSKINTSLVLGKFIVEYSDLSSFIHGGMKSYQEMMTANSEEKRHKEYNRICGLTFQLSNSIKLFSLLAFYQTDKEAFNSHYLRLDQILKKL